VRRTCTTVSDSQEVNTEPLAKNRLAGFGLRSLKPGVQGQKFFYNSFVHLCIGLGCTVASGQINPDWDCLQANHMSSSFKTNNLICSFSTLDDI
jgi:hypothetical protein